MGVSPRKKEMGVKLPKDVCVWGANFFVLQHPPKKDSSAFCCLPKKV